MRYRLLILILGPFILWSVYFVTLYGVQAIGCRANWDTAFLPGFSVLRVVLVAILAASTILSVAMYILAGRLEVNQLVIKRIGRYCAAAGILSSMITFPGVLWLELC
ncbi:hypothetical protein [Agrobacterium rosae]|uniref:Uncharacterized protein n=1 Tax=Agrobacterium rosae TaxID=1972867 RepID=A0A1R3U0N5_9HYPH|nr:hypothetical protein [Agrobacterium rosae]SCX34410.1 hypothetical protein DSM25559_4464 [Agrobacterium rosae]